MAITDQLKALYVKLGGDPNTGASNIEEWIDKIEDVAGSGSGSGGSSEFVITATVEDGAIENAVFDKSYDEINQAYIAGKKLKAKLDFVVSGNKVGEIHTNLNSIYPFKGSENGHMFLFSNLAMAYSIEDENASFTGFRIVINEETMTCYHEIFNASEK